MIQVNQIKQEDLSGERFDILITSTGYESRANQIAKKVNAKYQFCLGFDNERKDPIRLENDHFFDTALYEIIIISNEEVLRKLVKEILECLETVITQKSIASIYIDYSCMSKNWYSYILLSLYHFRNRSSLKIFFGYSHAKYEKYIESDTFNRIVEPLFGFCDLSIPSKPTALVIGLGNEKNRVLGFAEYFDAVPYLFSSDESYNEEYSKEIDEVNKYIIQETPDNNFIKYPIHDLIYSHFLIENLSASLANDYRVVIAPCGPKPFALLSMIVALNNELPIEVWRISPGYKIPKVDRKSTGLISTLELSFES